MTEYIVVMEGKTNTKRLSEEKAHELAEYIKRVFNIECEVKEA